MGCCRSPTRSTHRTLWLDAASWLSRIPYLLRKLTGDVTTFVMAESWFRTGKPQNSRSRTGSWLLFEYEHSVLEKLIADDYDVWDHEIGKIKTQHTWIV